jgi:hypothetical protein
MVGFAKNAKRLSAMREALNAILLSVAVSHHARMRM